MGIKEFKIFMVLHFTARNVGEAIWATWQGAVGRAATRKPAECWETGSRCDATRPLREQWAAKSQLAPPASPGPRLVLSIENIPTTTVAPGPGCGEARRASGQNPGGWTSGMPGVAGREEKRGQRCFSLCSGFTTRVTTSTWVSPLLPARQQSNLESREQRAGHNNDLCCLALCFRLGLVRLSKNGEISHPTWLILEKEHTSIKRSYLNSGI